MNRLDLVDTLKRALRLTMPEAWRLATNFVLFSCKDPPCEPPPGSMDTARIPVGVGDEWVCIPLGDLAQFCYEVQRAISGEYL